MLSRICYHSEKGLLVYMKRCLNDVDNIVNKQLWLRVKPASCYRKIAGSIPPGLHVKMSLGKILSPKLLLMCWHAPCMAATAISVCMYELL